MPTLLRARGAAFVRLCLLLGFVSCTSLTPVSSAEEPADGPLASLVNDYWEFRLSSNPLFATRAGDHRFNDQLGDASLAAAEKQQAQRKRLLARAKAISAADLDEAGAVNLDILQRTLEDSVREYEFNAHFIPITNRSGFHIDFPDLRVGVPLETVQDHENYIARLAAFRQYARDHIEVMRAGIEQGYTLPAVVLDGFEESIETHIVNDPEKSLLYEPLKKLPAGFDPATCEQLTAAAKQAIADSVVPGYQEFLEFMKESYVPKAREAIGAAALPNGREYYRHLVRKFTTLDLLPEEVHQTGQQEVKRIRAEMEQIIKSVEFDGDFAAFLEFLRTSEQFYAKTPEALLREVAIVLKQIDGQLPKLFKTLPRTPYGIREVPDYIAPRTTTAYYRQPAGDGSEAGFYYVNTFNLKSRPLYEVEALSLHEAVPGHHLQIALQQELQGLPAFRRFTSFTAFVEGWALYAERLGLEVGFYTDPYNDFGRLTYEMWRACRLVVDTGMHYLGWTRQQAIDFMAENTGLSLHNIRSEVDRYIAWPGQARGYKIGELKIRELRQLAETELGDRFDLREFHDVVLGAGSIPLEILEKRVRGYIDAAPSE